MADNDFELFPTIQETMTFLASLVSDKKRIEYIEWAQPRIQMTIERLEIDIQTNPTLAKRGVFGMLPMPIQLDRHKHTRLALSEELSRLKAQMESQLDNTQTSVKKIRWNGTEREIVFLFTLLKENGFLAKSEHLWILIERHFLNREGHPFKNKQLSKTYQDLNKEITNKLENIRQIVEKSKE